MDEIADVEEPIKNAPEDIRRIIERVLKLEKDKLHQKNKPINDDILKVIKEIIQ